MSNNKSTKITLGAMPTQSVVVYKDSNAFYSDGRTRELQCGYAKVGEETLSLIRQEPLDCPGRIYEAGDEVPEIFPNSIALVKMRAGTEYIWITPASYATYLENCLQCCEPLPQLIVPENFDAVPGDTIVDLTWSAVPNATNYIVQRDLDINFGTAIQVYSGALLLFGDTGLVNDTTYYYRIKAQGAGYQDSEWKLLSATPTV